MRLLDEDAVLAVIERVTNEAVERKIPRYRIQQLIVGEIVALPSAQLDISKLLSDTIARLGKYEAYIESLGSDATEDGVKVGEEYVRVRHGWWDNGRCSECGTPADRSVYGDDFYVDTDVVYYCPTCGSKMDLGLNGKAVNK